MEVFVRDYGFDARKVFVCSNTAVGKDAFGIKDVQTFVFHRAHVEVVGGDNHEPIEVKVQTEAFFVPANGLNKALHGKVCFALIGRFCPDLQQCFLAVCEFDGLFLRDEISGHQREEIRGFGERVIPNRIVSAVEKLALLHQVAV